MGANETPARSGRQVAQGRTKRCLVSTRNMRDRLRRTRNHTFFGITLMILLLYARPAMAIETHRTTQLEVAVYRDGVARVRQVVSVNATVQSISFALLGEAGDVLVRNEKDEILQYDLTTKEITIYTLGASSANLEYYTSTLTRKNGPVWTIELSLPVSGKVILPDEASIVYLSDKPTTIEAGDSRPILTLIQGPWEISYIIPLKTSTSTTSRPSPTPLSNDTITGVVGALGVLLFLFVTALFLHRRHLQSDQLSQIDTQVLNVIRSRGGRIFESELRDLLGIPKTSTWRHVKKLEKIGLLRTRKIGSQNEIVLT
jgi:uncharacterized membrane protein